MIYVDGSDIYHEPGVWIHRGDGYVRYPVLHSAARDESGTIPLHPETVLNNSGGSATTQLPSTRKDLYDIELSTGLTSGSPASFTNTINSGGMEQAG